MKHPDNVKDFMVWFKEQSEKHFATLTFDDACGLQHQKGTRWRPGLTDEELEQFQQELGFRFPTELTVFYREMNGTDLPGVSCYAGQAGTYYYAPVYFSYPDHIDTIKQLIDRILNVAGLTTEQVKAEGIPNIFPINDYYYMVIDGITNPVFYLTIAYLNHDVNRPYVYGALYTDTLRSFLIKDAFYRTDHISDLEEFPDKERVPNFWTTDER